MVSERFFDVIVVGGGPAGIMAAIRAAERKKSVLLLERNKSLAKKLLISGGERCNLTNTCQIQEFLEKFSHSGKFLRNAFAQFFNKDLISFFERSGLKLKTESNGKVFPANNRAASVLSVLEAQLKANGVTILFNQRVRKILISENVVNGVVTCSKKSFNAKSIVIATGGLSYPATGSSGDGYGLAKELGHSIVELNAALVPIRIKENFIRNWSGISLTGAGFSVYSGNKCHWKGRGDLLFTHYGLSGPVVLNSAALINKALTAGNDVTIGINFNVAPDIKSLDRLLLNTFSSHTKKSIQNICKSLIPSNMASGVLRTLRIRSEKSASEITADERKRLLAGLSDFRLTVTGLLPIKDAIITQGGVLTKEINPKTMASKVVPGLFFSGEVLDIDAMTGGFNMQAAFSTGWVCGDSA